jgi:N-acetylglucosaminyldiphosphoundecaprenol N-acetyl-beta-D-mannosaminyltransferase
MARADPFTSPVRAGVDFDRDVHCLMGLPIDAICMEGAVERVRQDAFSNRRCFVSTVNLNFLMAARSDAAFRSSVLHSDLVLADGMPLVWVARLLRVPIRERVAGAGLFESLYAHPGPPVSVFFFGGPDGAAQAACDHINRTSSGLRCAGFDSPGFGSVEQISEADRIERINRSGAQFIVVALGAKKGQAWIEYNRDRLNAPVLCHLGAVVNFTAGTVRRAPRWLQAIGGEWLWRIYHEPALWQRYWNDGVSFARLFWSSILLLSLQRWFSGIGPAPIAPTISIRHSSEGTVVELVGAWDRRALGPLRRALAAFQKQSGSVTLRMAGVTRIDSALIGLVMLAQGASRQSGRFAISDVSPKVRKLLGRNEAGYLLAEAVDAGADSQR